MTSIENKIKQANEQIMMLICGDPNVNYELLEKLTAGIITKDAKEGNGIEEAKRLWLYNKNMLSEVMAEKPATKKRGRPAKAKAKPATKKRGRPAKAKAKTATKAASTSPAKKKRGRPKGSKNKPKNETVTSTPTTPTTE